MSVDPGHVRPSPVSAPGPSPLGQDALVTVVIPAFNAAAHIRQTLESVSAQTWRSLEVLVVDDGSQDGTTTLVEEYASLDPRVRLLRQKNAGVGAARNTAIKAARGEFIAPVDSDDLWAPEKIEQQVACMRAHGERTGLVYCWSTRIDHSGELLGYGDNPDVQGQVRSALVLRNFLGNASVPLIRATVLKRVGLYLTREEQDGAQGCEDWDLHLRIAEQADVRLVPDYLVGYRQTSSAMSVQAQGMSVSFLRVIRRARQRNRDLPRALFRWSTGHFYNYLARKCYLWGEYGWCVQSLIRGALADPALMLTTSFYRILVKGCVRQVAGYQPPFSVPAPARHSSLSKQDSASITMKPAISRDTLFARIQARRWADARQGRL